MKPKLFTKFADWQDLVNRQYRTSGFGKLFRIDRLLNQRHDISQYVARVLEKTRMYLLESVNASLFAPA